MNKKWVVVSTVAAVVVAFIAGVVIFKERSKQEVTQVLQTNSEALVRAHSPIYGNPAAKVTIVEFFDPSCETCRAFYPIVKGLVNSSFGQVRLVVRSKVLRVNLRLVSLIRMIRSKTSIPFPVLLKDHDCIVLACPQWRYL